VDSVRCEFCQQFGREAKPDAIRAARKSVTFFSSPFRRGAYIVHLEGQHPAKWQEYQQLAPQQQLTFFVETAMVNNTNTATAATQQQSPEYTAIQKVVQQYKETANAAKKAGKKLQAENELLEKQLRKCQKQLGMNEMFAAHDKTKIENLLKEKGQLEELNKMVQGKSNNDNDNDSTNNEELNMEEV
jgi:hypothetical protein